MAIITIGNGGTYTDLNDMWTSAGSLNDDVIQLVSDVNDPLTTTIQNFSWTGVTFNLNGYTWNFNELPSDQYILKTTVGGVWWIFENGTINTNGGFLNLSPNSTNEHLQIFNDLNMSMTGADAAKHIIIQSSNNVTVSATNCIFEISATSNLNTSHILINKSATTGMLTLDKCIFRNSAAGIYGGGNTDNVIITNTDFVNCGTESINLTDGGNLTVSGCTFHVDLDFGAGLNNSLSARESTIGIAFGNPFGTSSDNAYIGYNVFDVNGTHGILYGNATDTDQGSGGLIEGNTFLPDFTTYNITARSSNLVIQKNNFLGSYKYLNHTIIAGIESGFDLREPNRAQRIIVRENKFLNQAITGVDKATWSYHNCIIKADNAQIYNNYFLFDQDTDFITSPNFTLIYPKGASGTRVYNNTMHCTSEDVRCFRFTDQGGINTEDTLIANNWITGTYLTHLWIDDLNQTAKSYITNNNMGTSGSLYGTYFDLSTKSYFTNNIQDDTSWKMRWGGDVTVTGDPKTSQGFAPIGQYLGTPPDPIISPEVVGWETAVSAYANINYVGLTGVTLNRLLKPATLMSISAQIESRNNLANLPTSASDVLIVNNVIG